jgi:REP element-mobilizing transposase RayT
LYHVTARGDGREDIYLTDEDRSDWLDVLVGVRERFNWIIHAYCLMSNHYHLLIETPDGNLAQGMRHLNGVYTQRFNRRHGRVGHVFQGRYKAILVEKDAYLLELSRYIVLNPVRAQMVHRADEWPWSNYRAVAGLCSAPAWLNTEWVLAVFGRTRQQAQVAYSQFVAEGKDQPSPWAQLKNQIYLGSDAFVNRVQAQIPKTQVLSEIPKSQCRPVAQPLPYFFEKCTSRDVAIVEAFQSGR